MTPKLTRAYGRTLCMPHATSGAPKYHTEGCEACADARAKGIIRPNVTSSTKRERCHHGLQQTQRGWIDWGKRARVRAARAKAVASL